MQIRRRLMMQESGGLPNTYQQVEWIECSGTQYIITDYVPTDVRIKIEWAYMLTQTQTGDNMQFGFSTGAAQNAYRLYAEVYDTTKWYAGAGTGRFQNVLNDSNAEKGKALNTKYSASLDSNSLVVNGYSASPTTFQNNPVEYLKMCLFAWNSRGLIQYINKGMRLYTIKFFENDVLSANFVPCVRKSDSKPGMFDTVSKTFYTNAGSGEFIIPT